MRKALIIAYIFPPLGGGGVQRTLKFVKYLPRFSWKPYVLTPKNAIWGASDHDETLIADIPDAACVVRTNNIEIYELLRKLVRRSVLRRKLKSSEQIADQIGIQMSDSEQLGRTGFKKLFGMLRPIPDSKFGWILFAVRKGIEVIKKEQIDVIYSTSPPNTDHIIGLLLKKLTRKPWVADFRDPWLPWQLMGVMESMPVRSRVEQVLETMVVKSADSVINVSELLTQIHKKRFPKYLANKTVTITNGYDPDDIPIAQPKHRDDGKVRMIYFGKLFRSRSPKSFLEALSMLRDECPDIEQKIEVVFLGQFDQPGSIEHQKLISAHKLEKIVKVLGYLPHHEALNIASQSDFLLMIEGNYSQDDVSKGIYTGKLFEYIALKKPIFGVLPEGCARDLIVALKVGIVADYNNVLEIKERLKMILLSLSETLQAFQPDPLLIQKFSRIALTSKLTEIFNSLAT